MSNELATINNNFPSQLELQSVSLIARTAHASGMYGTVGGEAKIMMILLAAKELGVGPCQALNGGIWNIQGKIEVSARLMNGLIRRSGHSIKVIRSDDECCTLKGTRTDGDSFEVSFTKQDAEKAGLWGSNTWKKYPGDMLYNRCMSRLGRRLFPDVIGQCYIEGEVKESKEVDRLEQADCEDVTITTPNKSPTVAQKNSEILHTDTPKLTDNELPKISADQALKLQQDFLIVDKECRTNMWTWLKDKYGVEEDKFEDIPEVSFSVLLNGIQRNLEKNVKAVNNAENSDNKAV